jgi:hypothetical protein
MLLILLWKLSSLVNVMLDYILDNRSSIRGRGKGFFL